ncbi:MAG TPA: GNAT family N-acetyltransferase [Rubrobacteraceae bacterium]|nr:GNAT family N-acetyltransferase [Rubrobacteraceae bacterium]
MRGAEVLRDLPRLETDRLVLRKMRLEDADAMFDYASDPEVTRYVIWPTHRTMEDSRAFLELTVSNYATGEGFDWGIVYKGDEKFIGTCGFVSRSPEHARAEVGYVISRRYWGRGLTAEALRAIIRFGFERMELNRIEARCIAGNTASARVLEKAGMTCEGTLRERERIQGKLRDMKMYSILKREYLAARTP